MVKKERINPSEENKNSENVENDSNNNIKRLYRSRNDRMIEGVCGGIAQYFNIDSVWVRLIAVLLIFMSGIGVVLYIIGIIIIPNNPNQKEKKELQKEFNKISEVKNNENPQNNSHHKQTSKKENKNHNFLGIFLIILGSFFLFKNFFDIDAKILIPIILIVGGFFLLINSYHR